MSSLLCLNAFTQHNVFIVVLQLQHELLLPAFSWLNDSPLYGLDPIVFIQLFVDGPLLRSPFWLL